MECNPETAIRVGVKPRAQLRDRVVVLLWSGLKRSWVCRWHIPKMARNDRPSLRTEHIV